MTKHTDVLDILRVHHDDMFKLLEELEVGKGDRSEVFDELADMVAAHTAVEEQILFPAVVDDKANELLHAAVDDHVIIKRLLADMLGIDAETEREEFDAQLVVLREALEQHERDEEEDMLFPIIRASMSVVERAALGRDVLAMFADMIGAEPRFDIPAETSEAAPRPHV
jgi:iron-sulfur cluster repair protein YtfE (RIC family)